MITDAVLAAAPLGEQSPYPSEYSPSLLFPIARKTGRDAIGITQPLPFCGADYWTAYELSWLNPHGKPCVAIAHFAFPCQSPFLIESKSFKLYLNSFNHHCVATLTEVESLLSTDLSHACGAAVTVKLTPLSEADCSLRSGFEGICLDTLDVACSQYTVAPELLSYDNSRQVSETLYSDLLKSNCPVTAQPDWGSVVVRYTGPAIKHESLLQYLVSYRQMQEFHEQCVERIFHDILNHCAPQSLSVCARYTRRGGLDINPYRSTEAGQPEAIRLCRQ